MMKTAKLIWPIIATVAITGCRSARERGFGFDEMLPDYPGPSLFTRTYFLRDDEKKPVPAELRGIESMGVPPQLPIRLPQDAIDSAIVFCVSYHFDKKREYGLPPGNVDYFVAVRDGQAPSGFSPPSPTALNALTASGFDVRSCVAARFPQDGERVPGNPSRYRGVEDMKTSRAAKVVYFQLVAAHGDMAIIRVGFYGGPLFGGGDELLIQRVGRSWKIHSKLCGWIS